RQDGPFLRGKATEIGYPVLIKAVAGGGGKGMRRVDQDEDFTSALTSARREALNAFGDDRVLVEKFVETPRHIEIQVMADMRGTTLHLFERDCSIQRRHQKIVEEAPAPGMTDGLRARMGAAAVQTAEAVGYAGAGTVEFIVPGNAPLSDDTPFYFMEMNTRLQVEHPVTEMVTGLDLVALQLRAAAGQRLDLAQDDVRLDGHAIEVRLYAEDPDNGFLPSSGQLDALEIPEGVGIRVDSGVREGDHVSPFYDPMVAKIIAHGRTRGAALDRLSDCLADTLIAGPKTNLMLLQEIVAHGGFGAGPVDTGFLDRELDALIPDAVPQRRTVAAELALDLIAQDQARVAAQVKGRSTMDHDPWNAADGFALGTVSSGMERSHGLVLIIDGRNETVTVEWPVDGPRITDPVADDAVSLSVVEADTALYGLVGGRQFRVTPPDYGRTGGGSSAGGTISAPMHGKVLAIAVTPGDTVEAGDPVATVEAMKMEHGLTAPRAGVVAVVHAAEGDQVGEGQALVSLEEPAAAA
ncbi:MAG: biotin/lipoyl-containing protein, partial [Pseudomonadota bacterium]